MKFVIKKYDQDFEMRLDRWIRREYGNFSQGVIEKSIRSKFVRVDNLKSEPKFKLTDGNEIYVEIHLHEKWKKDGESLKEDVKNFDVQDLGHLILKETDDFLVLNKPVGLDVQGGINVRYSVDSWIKSISKEYRLVHRIDRDTSGILLIAKTLSSSIFFAKLFKERGIKKAYRAIVFGNVSPLKGKINYPISNVENNPGLMCVDLISGKDAKTNFNVIKSNDCWTDVELEPHTGRKHQLRVHMSYLGHPIVGDKKYDFEKKTLYLIDNQTKGVMYLHAKDIIFKDKKGVLQKISAPLPSYWPKY